MKRVSPPVVFTTVLARCSRRSCSARSASKEYRRSSATAFRVAAVGAVTAIVPEEQRRIALSPITLVLTLLALAAFIGAIIFAQISNFVRPEDARKNLEKQSALTMREYIAETESGAEDAAFAFLVEGDRDLLEAYRHRTPQRLRFVTWASASQIAAIGILTAAVATLLLR